MGILSEFFVIFFGFFLELYRNSWEFFENYIGILWEFFGKLFEYGTNRFVCQDFGFCQDFVSRQKKEDEI